MNEKAAVSTRIMMVSIAWFPSVDSVPLSQCKSMTTSHGIQEDSAYISDISVDNFGNGWQVKERPPDPGDTGSWAAKGGWAHGVSGGPTDLRAYPIPFR